MERATRGKRWPTYFGRHGKIWKFAFIRSYGKQSYNRDEEEVVETDEVGDITTDKVRLTTKRHVQRVLDALKNGEMTEEYVAETFSFDR